MDDRTKVVKVVTTVPNGVRTVPINSQNASNNGQNMMTNQVDSGNNVIYAQPVQNNEIVMTPINLNPQEEDVNQNSLPLANNMPNGEYTQNDVDMVNNVNDLVKVVDVKYSMKTVLIMVAVIVVLVIIFLVFELPMLMEL